MFQFQRRFRESSKRPFRALFTNDNHHYTHTMAAFPTIEEATIITKCVKECADVATSLAMQHPPPQTDMIGKLCFYSVHQKALIEQQQVIIAHLREEIRRLLSSQIPPNSTPPNSTPQGHYVEFENEENTSPNNLEPRALFK